MTAAEHVQDVRDPFRHRPDDLHLRSSDP